MVEEHFSRANVERFLRGELPRMQTRDFVRHLMRQCTGCAGMLVEVTRRPGVRFLVEGLEDPVFRSDPDLYDEAMEEILRLLDPTADTTGRA